MTLPVSVLIMTQNEEANVRFALESVVGYFDQVIVADSFSSDRTAEIVKSYPKVEFYQNQFKNWADQRNWMLANCNIRNKTIFFLDADEYLTKEFLDELGRILASGAEFASIQVRPRLIFMGRLLRFSYGHPKVKRIFSRNVRFAGSGAREYAVTVGNHLELAAPLIHHDRKPIFAWLDKHNKNSDREAASYFNRETLLHRDESVGTRSAVILWVRRHIWDRLPLLTRPFIYFIYRYFILLGFLDGRAGFMYCLFHALIYQSLIDVKILEKQAAKR